MKRFNYLGIIVLVISLICLTNNCKKESSAPVPTTDSTKIISLEINQFIWGGLNYYYYWVDSVPKLQKSYFQSNVNNLNNFLSPYTDHEKLFYDLLYQYTVVDKWSWIVNDYTQLQNELNGINTTMGFQFGLNYIDATRFNVVGYVTYVLKNSPADNAGIKRGDLFIKIDDQQITVANYQTLLFSKNSFKISFATYNSGNNTLAANGREITLTGIQMQENPILFDTVYNVNGINVGYLVYNGFLSDFDLQLNDVFKTFKTAAIQQLILDLRYNGGGSVESADYLASMIYGTNNSQTFIKTVSNANNLTDPYLNYTYNFIDTIARTSTTPRPTTINSVNLTKLYVLTQKNNTASASELIINGLKSHIPVILFGSGTVGKYVGSVTLMDYIAKEEVNPNNSWAMQPIVFRSANSNGESYYKYGFAPKDSIFENYKNIMPLGNLNEPFLQAAINDIKGIPQASALKSASFNTRTIATSKDYLPHSKEMFKNLKYFKSNNSIFQKK